MSKFTLSKKQWEHIGKITGWTKTAVNYVMDADGDMQIASGAPGSEHRNNTIEKGRTHISMDEYDKLTSGEDCWFTEKEIPLESGNFGVTLSKGDERRSFIVDSPKVDRTIMCDNCGGGSHHTEECPYSFGANPQ